MQHAACNLPLTIIDFISKAWQIFTFILLICIIPKGNITIYVLVCPCFSYNSRLIRFHFLGMKIKYLPNWLSFNYNKASCQMQLQLYAQAYIYGNMWVCVCVFEFVCVCNYNGPGHICVAYFEAYFLAKRRLQLQQQQPVCAHGIKLQMMLGPGREGVQWMGVWHSGEVLDRVLSLLCGLQTEIETAANGS